MVGWPSKPSRPRAAGPADQHRRGRGPATAATGSRMPITVNQRPPMQTCGLAAGGRPVDAEPAGGDRAEHDRRVPRRSPRSSQLPAARPGRRRSRAGRAGRRSTVRPDVSLPVDAVVAATHGVGVRRPRWPRVDRADPAGSCRPPPPAAAPAALVESGAGLDRAAGWCPARRACRSGRAGWTRGCRPPTIIAAMPIAMPSADRKARSRRVRRPDQPDAAARPAARSRTAGAGALTPPARRAARSSATIRPSRISTWRGRPAAMSRSWVMTHDGGARRVAARAAAPARLRRRPSRGRRSARRPAAAPGSPTSARAIATRCRSPPDSSCGRWSSRCPRPTRSSAARRRGAGARRRHPGVEQAVGDVLRGAQPVGEVELLEDEADPPAPQRGQLPVGQRGDVVPVDAHGAAGRPVQGADDVQHRRLAGAGRADDGDQLAGARRSARRRPARSPRRGSPTDPVDGQHRLGDHEPSPRRALGRARRR